jgi:hypothetical protein
VSIHRRLVESELHATVAAHEPAPAAAVAASDYVIDVPQSKDAPAIARCFLDAYGRHYVHPEVFSPRRYWHSVESGELIPVVARDRHGEVVGHVALERAHGMQVAERGQAVVLSAHRGHGLLERMTERLSDRALEHGLDGIYADPVTVHTFSQRNDERAGMPVCAVLLGVNPENVRPNDGPCPTAGQRQSCLRTFRFLRPPGPRMIHAPAAYRDVLLKLYASLGATPTLATPTAVSTADSQTDIKLNGHGYGVISFRQIGPNAPIELAQALRDLRTLGASTVQLTAPLSDPGLPLLADSARAAGFFLCGLGPAFLDGTDVFLLQLLTEPLDTGKLQLFTTATKELVAFIDTDRAAVTRG